jgi:hypothetical protein
MDQKARRQFSINSFLDAGANLTTSQRRTKEEEIKGNKD